jgi:hypothetical protein
MEEFVACFADVTDPRQDNARHDLHEILMIALCTMLCGGEDCSDMPLFGRAIAAEPETAPKPLKLVTKAAAEVSQGAGLGRVLSPDEGRARIAAYATPTKVEDWAGPLAGPTELERDFGVPRSTLHTWQKQRAVIGLLVGVRKHAFPTEQFIDGRPMAGLAAIVEAIGDVRTAWLWLREPNPALAGVTPLTCLKAGTTDKVVTVARSTFAGT